MEILEGVLWGQGIIPEQKNEIQLKLKVPSEIEFGSVYRLRIVGNADFEETTIRDLADCQAVLKKTFPNLIHIPHGMENTLLIGVEEPRAEGAKDSSR